STGALADINRALAHDTSESDFTALLYAIRAEIYSSQDQTTQAMADTNEAIKVSPTEARYYTQRAGIYASQGNYEAALSDMNSAIQQDNTILSNYLARADINSHLNNPADAASDYLLWITGNQKTVTNQNAMHSGDSVTLQMDTGVVF